MYVQASAGDEANGRIAELEQQLLDQQNESEQLKQNLVDTKVRMTMDIDIVHVCTQAHVSAHTLHCTYIHVCTYMHVYMHIAVYSLRICTLIVMITITITNYCNIMNTTN